MQHSMNGTLFIVLASQPIQQIADMPTIHGLTLADGGRLGHGMVLTILAAATERTSATLVALSVTRAIPRRELVPRPAHHLIARQSIL
jgi:hypothetical protein